MISDELIYIDSVASLYGRNNLSDIVKAAANDNYPFAFGGSGAHIRDAYVHH